MEKKEQLDESDGKQKDEIPQGYEEYLVLLQQRNRLLKKLKAKDKKQKDLEKREQGFSLYLNGANVDLKLGKPEHKSARKAKTADVENNGRHNLAESPKAVEEDSSRAWTAPSKHGRRGWGKSPSQIKIKTEKGENMEFKTGKVTGKYSEDFEAYQSLLEEQLAEEDDSDEEIGEEEEIQKGEPEEETIEDQTGTDEEDIEETDDNDQKMTLTIKDVKALRRSIEANKEIVESIRSIRENIPEADNSDTDEDIEEDIDKLRESREVDPSQLPQLGKTLPKGNLESDLKEDKSSSAKTVMESYNSKSETGNNDKLEPQPFKRVEQPVEMISAPRKSRPLSASRKRRQDDSTISSDASVEIANAILEENRKIEVKQSDPPFGSRVERETKSAPSKQKQSVTNEEPVNRPSSIATATVDNEMIGSIVERVKKMTAKQQVHLLKMLSKLEELDITEDDATFSTAFFEKKRSRESTEGVAVGPLFKETSESQVKGTTALESSAIVSSGSDETDCGKVDILEVCVEINSNWGHPDMVGLTEVEFFDDDKKAVRLKEDHIEVLTTGICYTPNRNLVNSKTKTVKERHMWKCQLKQDENVKLIFHIPKDLIPVRKSNFGITKIAIWNYNKSLYELNIGAKEVKVMIDDTLVWEGIVDKGCGNQVFDYSKVINLYEDEVPVETGRESQNEATERCKTATLTRDSSELANLPKVETQHISNNQTEAEGSNRKAFASDEIFTKPRPPSTKADHPVRRSPLLRKLTPDSTIPVSAEKQSVSRDHLPASRSSKISTETDPISRNSATNDESDSAENLVDQKPVWLPDAVRDAKDEKSFTAEVENSSSPRPRSRPTSGRRAGAKSTSEGSNARTASAGRRKGTHLANEEDRLDADAKEDISEFLNEKPKQKRPLSGRRRKDEVDGSTSTGKNEEQDGRRKYREIIDKEFEQSLDSINKFEHSHLGRITSNLNLEADGDALDALIQPNRAVKEESLCSDKSIETQETSQRDVFEIPTLPTGRNLVLNLKSTWGDRHYIGLNGVEVFTSTGELAKILEITADPSDINILPEYDHDPRVVSNLNDGVYMTRDDLHLWLTPFTPGKKHIVSLVFDKPVIIAMLRIWNYNKSRIHSTRGVRDIEITLDDSPIFKGEIARASGILSKESEPYGDIILFTTDEDILEEVAKHDFTYEYDIVEEEEEQMMQSVERDRPKTADQGNLMEPLERPYTCPKSRQNADRIIETQVSTNLAPLLEELDFSGKVVRLNFTQTWGDQYYLGLTGIELLGENFEPLPIELSWMDACPRDLNELEDYGCDDRTLDKLIDGENVTNSDEHMWLIPFTEGEDHILTISFPEKKHFTGIRIWNYNKTTEDTYRGAKNMHMYIDDNEVSPEMGFLLRKGPGHCHFDFAQDILFYQEDESNERKEITRPKDRCTPRCENVLLPTGFVFQIRLFSTWGDPYYIGLNGLEFYNERGTKIPLDENNITAFPHSVNVLEGIENDMRTPEKLVDDVNDTYDASHMWLAPIFPGVINVIYIVFDSPISLSMMKLWNYSKTGSRGVRQFALLVDDLLVYNGVLPQVTHHTRAILPTLEIPVPSHTICFTDEQELLNTAPKNLQSAVSVPIEQDVQMTNDNSIVNPYASPNSAGKTVDPANRPMTSFTGTILKR
ncbi:katanin-interacting protein-like isoform X2 [Rhopilema esculentum]|uniref:katanin-interacting protein-like isoform X2 n=1 Tax=Rhopilema esculentum TaxID=499914 RepID=UPI0031D6558B